MDEDEEEGGLKEDETPKIYVQNIVAFVDLSVKLDLERLAFELPESEYHPDRFPALIVKFKEPKVSALLFRNGKMNVTGANNMTDLEEGVSKLVDKLCDLGIDVTKNPKIKVTNQVCTVDLGIRLNLDDIAFNVENVEYEPESFPGLVYRPYDWPHESKPSILVFSNGKLVIAGVRKVSEAKIIVEELVETLTDTGLIDKSPFLPWSIKA